MFISELYVKETVATAAIGGAIGGGIGMASMK